MKLFQPLEKQLKLDERHLCLDFANTVEWHASDLPEERLRTFADLVAWAEDIQLISPEEAVEMSAGAAREPEAAQAALQEAIALREAIYHIFSAAGRGQAPEQADLDVFNRTLSDALSRAAIQPGVGSDSAGRGPRKPARLTASWRRSCSRLPSCSPRMTCTGLENARTRGAAAGFSTTPAGTGAGAGARWATAATGQKRSGITGGREAGLRGRPRPADRPYIASSLDLVLDIICLNNYNLFDNILIY